MSEEFEHDIVRTDADEGGNRGRIIIFAILGYSLVACAGYFFFFQLSADTILEDSLVTSNEPGVVVEAGAPSALYFAPVDDRVLTPQQIVSADLRVVHDSIELATLVGTYPEIRAIYIHPLMLEQTESAVFRNHYEARKMLIAINAPLSQLASAVEIIPNSPDLPLEEFVSGVAVAVIQARPEGPPLEFVATYPQFDQVPSIVAGLR